MTDFKMRATLSVLLIFAFISVSACTTTSFTEIKHTPVSIQKYIELGDMVKVTTTDRRELEFKVDEINALSIRGDGQQVLFSEIDTIEKKRENRSSFYYLIKGLEAAASLPF